MGQRPMDTQITEPYNRPMNRTNEPNQKHRALPHASDFAPSGLLNTIIEFCKKTVYLPTIQTFF
jgi:hypothetical protein